jgi:predicted 3-demethylubiquinone-9 3-methyltransferase (glyoxalase superfamily)
MKETLCPQNRKNTICLWFDKDAQDAARFYGATFPDSKVTARCCRSLLHEVHVTVPLQEFKIAYPVKIILRANFHFRVLDDLG